MQYLIFGFIVLGIIITGGLLIREVFKIIDILEYLILKEGGDTVEIDKIDWEKFFDNAEEICFDCGSTVMALTVISRGVALCASCLETIEGDYPKKTEP